MGSDKWGDVDFGKRLKRYREREGWTQAELAELLSDKGIGMTAAQVARIEKGVRSVRAVEAGVLADLYGVSVDALLNRRSRPKADLQDAAIAVLETQQEIRRSLSSLELTLRNVAKTLADADSDGRYAELAADCERARKALTTADKAVEKIGATTELGSAKAAVIRLFGTTYQRGSK